MTLSYETDPRLLEPVVLWADFGQALIVALGSVCPGGWHFCILAGHRTPHSQQQAVLSWTCPDQWKGIVQVALGKTHHFLLKAHIPRTWIPYPIYISLLYNPVCLRDSSLKWLLMIFSILNNHLNNWRTGIQSYWLHKMMEQIRVCLILKKRGRNLSQAGCTNV